MPLAFTQEDFLVFRCVFEQIWKITRVGEFYSIFPSFRCFTLWYGSCRHSFRRSPIVSMKFCRKSEVMPNGSDRQKEVPCTTNDVTTFILTNSGTSLFRPIRAQNNLTVKLSRQKFYCTQMFTVHGSWPQKGTVNALRMHWWNLSPIELALNKAILRYKCRKMSPNILVLKRDDPNGVTLWLMLYFTKHFIRKGGGCDIKLTCHQLNKPTGDRPVEWL